MQVTTIGLDLAKHWFQVHGVEASGREGGWRKLRQAAGRPVAPCRRPGGRERSSYPAMAALSGRSASQSSPDRWTPPRCRSAARPWSTARSSEHRKDAFPKFFSRVHFRECLIGNICAKERAQGRPTLGNIVDEQAIWGDGSPYVSVVPLVCRYHVLPILNVTFKYTIDDCLPKHRLPGREMIGQRLRQGPKDRLFDAFIPASGIAQREDDFGSWIMAAKLAIEARCGKVYRRAVSFIQSVPIDRISVRSTVPNCQVGVQLDLPPRAQGSPFV
jgi:hypothetical protein